MIQINNGEVVERKFGWRVSSDGKMSAVTIRGASGFVIEPRVEPPSPAVTLKLYRMVQLRSEQGANYTGLYGTIAHRTDSGLFFMNSYGGTFPDLTLFRSFSPVATQGRAKSCLCRRRVPSSIHLANTVLPPEAPLLRSTVNPAPLIDSG
jgi:hypothetical protein